MPAPVVETLNRRSRFSRTPRSAQLRLSERDLAMLQALVKYRYLRSTHLYRLVGGNPTTLRWRLRDLFDAGLLNRPPAQWELANALYTPTVYELSARGAERLLELGLPAPEVRRPAKGRPGYFWHSLFVAELMASFEIDAREHGYDFIPEMGILERLAAADVGHPNPRAFRVGEKILIPDGLFGIRSKRGVTLFAVEMDRGQEPLVRKGAGSDYKAKFDLYRQLVGRGLYREQLSTPAPLIVLHVTTTEARMSGMMRLANGAEFHLFRTLPSGQRFYAPIGQTIAMRDSWMRSDASLGPLPS